MLLLVKYTNCLHCEYLTYEVCQSTLNFHGDKYCWYNVNVALLGLCKMGPWD